MASLSHQERMLKHCEDQQAAAVKRANAIFEIVSLLAQAERHVTDHSLRCRIRYALEHQSPIAMDGEHFTDVSSAIPIWSQDGFDPKRAGQR